MVSSASPSLIESVLAQMRALQQAGQGLPVAPAASLNSGAGFAAELQSSLQRVSALQNQAMGQARAFQLGQSGIALSDVMIDMQKADLALQTSVQVRNKLLAAYQEIANMPV